jgi:hypothetical protein
MTRRKNAGTCNQPKHAQNSQRAISVPKFWGVGDIVTIFNDWYRITAVSDRCDDGSAHSNRYQPPCAKEPTHG